MYMIFDKVTYSFEVLYACSYVMNKLRSQSIGTCLYVHYEYVQIIEFFQWIAPFYVIYIYMSSIRFFL